MHSEAYYKNVIKKDIIELLKWSPGIIFPLANIMQIIEMYKTKKTSEIDACAAPPRTAIELLHGTLKLLVDHWKSQSNQSEMIPIP